MKCDIYVYNKKRIKEKENLRTQMIDENFNQNKDAPKLNVPEIKCAGHFVTPNPAQTT